MNKNYFLLIIVFILLNFEQKYAREKVVEELGSERITTQPKLYVTYNQAKDAVKLKRISLYTQNLSKEERAKQFTKSFLIGMAQHGHLKDTVQFQKNGK